MREAFIQHAVEESATTGTALQGLLYIIDFREVYYLWLTREAELVVVKCMLSFLFLVRSQVQLTPTLAMEVCGHNCNVYSYHPVCGHTVYDDRGHVAAIGVLTGVNSTLTLFIPPTWGAILIAHWSKLSFCPVKMPMKILTTI